jgi:hypothetical protein
MAHPNYDERRQAVERILSAGLEIKGREAQLLAVLFNCSPSAIGSDVKILRAGSRSGNGLRVTGVNHGFHS